MSLHVAVRLTSVPRGTSKKKRETEKVQGVEAVEAIVDLIVQARGAEEQARERGHMEMVEKLTNARMDTEGSL